MHGRGAEAAHAAGGVDRDVAAADHDHRLAGEVGRFVELHAAEEVERRQHAAELLARDVQARRDGGAGREQHGVEAVRPERAEVLDARVRLDLDADRGHVRDVALDDLGGKAVARDREAERAARLRCRLEDLHAVALAAQLPRGGEAGRPRADDRDALAGRLAGLDTRAGAGRVVRVADEALDPADRQRALEVAARAALLARRVAGAAEAADERRRLEHELERLLVLAAAHERDVAVRLDPGRAGIRARRGAGALDERLLRHRLRERDVRGAAGDELAVELVRHRHRARGLALAAPGAEARVDEARLLLDLDGEAAAVVAEDPLDLGVGQHRQVRVMRRRRHLRRRDAARAVERGEDLAEQDHLAADRRLLLDDEHAVAHRAELQRRLHAADAAADDERVVLRAAVAVAAVRRAHARSAGPSGSRAS